MKIKSILKLMVIAISLISVNGCNNKKEEVKEESTHEEKQTVEFTEAQFKNADVQFGKIEMRNLSSVIQCNGVLDVPPQNLVSISLPIGGILKSTELLQGMKVTKGQVIAVFEHPDYIQLQQEYIQAKANLDYSEAEYKRQEDLQKENVNSQKSFQKTKADFLSLKAQVNGLEKKLAQLGIPISQLDKGNISNSITITSPINGYVTKVNINIGKYAAPNDVVFEIVDTEHLHAELTVYEKDITKIKVGQVIRFTLSNESGNERTAKVHLIGREISSERTVRIHGHLDTEDENLLPGMYIKAVIEVGENKTASLPEKAIIQKDSKNYIFIKTAGNSKDGYTFKMIEVAIGVSEDGYTEVTVPQEVNSNSEVVINGAYDLLGKMFNSEEKE
ncbi:MAG TPA: efflux RND transporter periplasmic adaptor subunit [Bacteroidia bacterium]|nr:efflux RND transporter periplasmic adaptor subunit [Bacteroidia bacterium]